MGRVRSGGCRRFASLSRMQHLASRCPARRPLQNSLILELSPNVFTESGNSSCIRAGEGREELWLASRSSFGRRKAHLRWPHPFNVGRYGGQPSPAFMSEGWRRGDLHPRPKIHPRRNLRCVSASDVSLPASRDGKTAESQPRKISLSTSETAVNSQPA